MHLRLWATTGSFEYLANSFLPHLLSHWLPGKMSAVDETVPLLLAQCRSAAYETGTSKPRLSLLIPRAKAPAPVVFHGQTSDYISSTNQSSRNSLSTISNYWECLYCVEQGLAHRPSLNELGRDGWSWIERLQSENLIGFIDFCTALQLQLLMILIPLLLFLVLRYMIVLA
jgi:hypothetical protein